MTEPNPRSSTLLPADEPPGGQAASGSDESMRPLRVLLVEDSPLDAELLEAHLREAGLAFRCHRVDAEATLRRALKGDPWDIVLSDYKLPTMDGHRVLEIVQHEQPDLPVILVSGHIGEERAADILRAGAQDYVAKSNLARLVTALRREVQNARSRQAQHRVDAELRRTRELFATMLTHLLDVVLLVDEAAVCRYASPSCEATFGFTPEELLGKNLHEFGHPEDLPILDTALAAVFLGSAVKGPGGRVRHRDGHWVDIEVNLSRIRDAEGRHQALAVVRDVTERNRAQERRKHMEAQLQEALKLEALGRLASGIAHELKTPIQFIGSNTQFLQDAFEIMVPLLPKQQDGREGAFQVAFLREEIPQALTENQEGVRRITRLIQAMQEMSRPGLGEKVPTDLNHLIESAFTVALGEWKYVAKLERSLDPALPPVVCRPQEFQQALLNLLMNAVQAIEARFSRGRGELGLLRVSTRVRKGQVEVAVADNGVGIPREVGKRIFEPFFSTRSSSPGTGQGLSIALDLVERMEGTLEWESEPGVGSTFRILLPVANPQRSA